MRHLLISTLIAVSLGGVPPTTAAAEGIDNDDIGKLLFGLAAVAVVGAAIEDSRNRSEDRADTTTPQQTGWSDMAHRERDRAENRRALPRECLRDVETRFGTQRMFGRRCLERNYAYSARLPDRCAVRVYTTRGPRNGFDPLCLRDQGYRAARRE